MKKIQVHNETVTILENINFPELIRNNLTNAYLQGLADEPFYICDLGDIVRKHYLWCEKLPRVEPFYALKCNPNEIVVKMLARLNIGFDCASREEIIQVLDAGVPPEKIFYANPCKASSFIAFAKTHNVKKLVFDTLPELKKIAVYYPDAELILRIFVGAHKARCPLGLKFGALMEEVPGLLLTAITLGLNVVGVSFHVGSGCFDASAYKSAISMCSQVFEIAEQMNISLSLLDIGGGFPGNLDSQEEMDFFDDVCQTINACLDEYFPKERNIRFVAEPGRYYVSSAFQLACSIVSVRSNPCANEEDRIYSYYLNDGVYGSFNCTVFDHYIGRHYLLNDCYEEAEDNRTYSSVFWGPTCDSMDKILENFRIRKLNVGDCVVFKEMGAYTFAAASTFNGFKVPYIKYFSSIEDWNRIFPLLFGSLVEEQMEALYSVSDSIDSSSMNYFNHQ